MSAHDLYTPPPTGEIPVETCTFYHTMDLPGHGTVEGAWDLRGRVGDYVGHVDVSGKTVLDVGCASGFLSFSLEAMGAEVTSFDADDASRYHLLPFRDSAYMADHEAWLEETNAWIERLHNGYWFAHRAFQSANKVVYGNIYDLPEALPTFDVAVIGQMLIHVRDPIQALTQVALHCGDTLVITEDILNTRRPIAKLKASATKGGPPYHFWVLSRGTYRELLAMLGFDIVAFTRDRYYTRSDVYEGNAPLCTLTARRQTIVS